MAKGNLDKFPFAIKKRSPLKHARKLLGQETFAFFALFRAIRVPNVIVLENS